MRKIVKLYSLTLIFLVFSSNSKAASTESGKSFFMPQPLTAMLVPLSMRPQLIMHGNADAQKSTIVHLRPLATQPEYVPPFQVPPFSSPQPLYAPQQPSVKYEKIEQLSTTEGATEPAQAMPLENVTIPLNEVESPEALTIPLNEIVEPRMVPGSLSYDAPNLYEQPNFLTNQQNNAMHLGQMQVLPGQESQHGVTFAMTPFFIRSTNGSDLRHYFFPGGKDELVIKGSEPGGSCDVSGTWLRIVGTNGTPEYSLLKNSFQSTFQINPVYTYMGVHFHVRKQVGNWWGDMQLPVAQVSVEHKMKEYGLSGNVVSLDDIDAFGEGNRKASITDEYSVDAVGAFSNATLQYHKLSKKTLTHYGMGDATIKLGRNHGRMQYFTKFVLPTSQPPTNECMFEPQLGNGSHLGVGFGGTWTYQTKVDYFDSLLAVQSEVDCTYLFSNTQMRTFDIIDFGPFSRYLLFRVATAAAGRPLVHAGPTILTKKCTVSPNGQVNALLSSFLIKKNMRWGLTYSLHAAQQESIKIIDSFNDSYGVLETVGGNVASNVYFFANPGNSAITQNAALDANTAQPHKRISIADLDINSATRPLRATSQLALSCGSQHQLYHEDIGIDVVSGMALNHGNTSLATWFATVQLTWKL